jgi:hypothetical protein
MLESGRSPLSNNVEPRIIDNWLVHGCRYFRGYGVSLAGWEGGQMLPQTGGLNELDESRLVHERSRRA